MGANSRLYTPRQSTQSAFGRTIINASASASHMSPTSSTGSSVLSRRQSEMGGSQQHQQSTTPTSKPPPAALSASASKPAAPSLAAAAAAAANLIASRNAAAAAARASSGGGADAAGSAGAAAQDQMKRRIAELELDLKRATAAKHQLEVRTAAGFCQQLCSLKHPTGPGDACPVLSTQHSEPIAKSTLAPRRRATVHICRNCFKSCCVFSRCHFTLVHCKNAGTVRICRLHLIGLQDENLQLEKARADLTLDLKRSTAAKDAAESIAKAAQEQLQGVLAELDDAKHSTEAASTTSQFVRKVCCCCLTCAQVAPVQPYLQLH
jgi:hypothetical protein